MDRVVHLRESKGIERVIETAIKRMSAAKFRRGGQNQGSHSRSREGRDTQARLFRPYPDRSWFLQERGREEEEESMSARVFPA